VTQALVLYAAMIVAAAFQEEFAPLAGALAAHHGHGEIWLVGAACATGSWLHGVALYALGRRGHAILKRPALLRPIEMLRAHKIGALLGIRFAYGLRMTLPLVCGAADIGFGTFALWTAISSAAWAALFTTAGWFLGEFAVTQLRHFRRYEIRAGVILLALGGLFWIWRRQRARIETGEPRVA
jgi:membrane protein DedA with SNARE-associated domain